MLQGQLELRLSLATLWKRFQQMSYKNKTGKTELAASHPLKRERRDRRVDWQRHLVLLYMLNSNVNIHAQYPSWCMKQSTQKGLARTQIPTNKNDDVEFPTFGEIAGVNHSLVQWSSLALEEPPSWSWLTSRPGKYASLQRLQKS